MQMIGLTGGIASGKSTVRRMLEKRGARVLDADAIYHALIQPQAQGASPLARAIGQRFPGVLTTQHTIDRAALGTLVFGNASARADLERITHPAVAAEFARQVGLLQQEGVDRVIYDVPLLFERHLQASMQGVLVVWVPRAVQRARLMAREQLDAVAVDQRLAAQMPLDEKRALATWVIDNSGSEAETERQVETWWNALIGRTAPPAA